MIDTIAPVTASRMRYTTPPLGPEKVAQSNKSIFQLFQADGLVCAWKRSVFETASSSLTAGFC